MCWQQQIQIDIEYFEPKEKLFQRVIDVMSGFLQIKQAEYKHASRQLLIQTEKDRQERNQILIDTEAEQRERDALGNHSPPETLRERRWYRKSQSNLYVSANT